MTYLRAIPLPTGSLVPGQLEMEAVVRMALGDRSVIIDDIRPSVLLAIRDRLILVAYHKLAWIESDLDQLIAGRNVSPSIGVGTRRWLTEAAPNPRLPVQADLA